MTNAKISSGQLFMLMVIFSMGTAILRPLAIQAGKDSWLATLSGAIGGMIILWIYTTLYRAYPTFSFTGYMVEILGKKTGYFFGLLYTLFFIHGAARDVREGGDLIGSTILERTPVTIVIFVLIMAASYILIQGIEVLARTAETFFFILILLIVVSSVCICFSEIIDLSRLFPILGSGWTPVIKTTLKQTIEFPYEEFVCFTMIFPHLKQLKTGIKAGFAAIIISGLLLSYINAINIVVLGPEIVSHASFPLLHTISLVDINNFIQRLDILAVLLLIFSDFFKITIFFYAGVIAATDIFQIQDYRKVVYPIGIIILLSSKLQSANFAEQIQEGNILLVTTFFLFGVIIPVFLVIINKLQLKYNKIRRS
ncbi:TPA: GerAB/ArcD/ProY family transporter [Bacillus cereus]